MTQPALNLPRNLGGYRLVERIGVGGMGVVYRAEDPRSHTTVAVKVIHEHLRNDAYIERFRNEAHLASLMTSPYIVRVIEFGIEEGEYYLVTEFVQGTRLSDVIARGKIDVEQALAIAIEVTMGLQAAAVQRVVHRDIKPDNIIITPDGSLKLMDFGIARLSYVETQQLFLGTVSYAAPEQFRGHTDVRSDIYSLGIVLFQLLAGHLPFRSTTFPELMRMHEEAMPDVESLPGPTALRTLVAKCLEKDPARRYQDASGLLIALHEVRRALASTAGENWLNETMTAMAGTVVSRPPSDASTVVAKPAVQPTPERPPIPDPRPSPSPATKSLVPRLLIGAGAALIVVVIAAILLLSSGGGDKPTPSQSSVATPGASDNSGAAVVQPTSAPAPAPTSAPAPPPGPASIPSGWRRFSASGLDLALPPAYAGGTPNSLDVDSYASSIQVQGFGALASTILFVKPNMTLLIFDNDFTDQGTNVNVTRFPNSTTQTLDALADQQAHNLVNADFRVTDRSSLNIGGMESRRIQADINSASSALTVVQYTFKKGDDFWVVSYNATQAVYNRLRPSFEQSAQTIRIN